ncbi:MAG: hypothetical protein FOGNACKC_00747 [Anaerolineae bacterium]|nr:hypothetical protein [Anaerolineae bacterium]
MNRLLLSLIFLVVGALLWSNQITWFNSGTNVFGGFLALSLSARLLKRK